MSIKDELYMRELRGETQGEGAQIKEFKIPGSNIEKNNSLESSLGPKVVVVEAGTVADNQIYREEAIVTIISDVFNESLDTLVPKQITKLGSEDGPVISMIFDSTNCPAGTERVTYIYTKKGEYYPNNNLVSIDSTAIYKLSFRQPPLITIDFNYDLIKSAHEPYDWENQPLSLYVAAQNTSKLDQQTGIRDFFDYTTNKVFTMERLKLQH